MAQAASNQTETTSDAPMAPIEGTSSALPSARLLEAILALVRSAPGTLLLLPLWLLRGRSHLEGELAKRVALDELLVPESEPRLTPATLVRTVRAHQWVKNGLLFVPLLTAHKLEPTALLRAGIGALAFSLCASSVYVLNDLMDLQSDRRHRTKRHRPLASGAMPLSLGLALIPLLLVAGLGTALLLSPTFAAVLGLYLVITTAYTFALKREPIIDVLCLAGLYSLRIFAGGATVGVPVSDWLIAFSMFFFLSLALVKRAAELRQAAPHAGGTLHGRGYSANDLGAVTQVGVASGQLSVLVFAVYVQSDTVRSLYTHPWALWFVCPLIFYWLGRVWLLVGRDEMHDDPVVFALRDRNSYLVGALAALALTLAT